jgi:putative peptide zinc metalloprotease protein
MSSLYSPRWHRVAGLRPQLAPQLRVRRQRVRGDRWWVLMAAQGGRSVRLSATAWALAGRLDGRHSLQQLWDGMLAQPGDPATQDEVIDMLTQLHDAALLQADRAADFDALLRQREHVAAPQRSRSLLAWRVPLVDPGAWLRRRQGWADRLFSPAAAAAWVLALCSLAVLLLQHAPTLWAHGAQWMATPRYALLAALLYVPIKLLHELAHGLAVQRWGGTVSEAGVTLMLGLPVPYVDATAASGFVRRRQRVIVGAAGMMAELALAAVALPLWLWLDAGLARDAAFVTLVIAGVSTLLFNANPLQRLDGYYIATDLLDLPNLGPRSRQWWLDQLQRRLLRLSDIEPMVVARGEAPWLAAYSPLSWLFTLGIGAAAVFWLGQLSLVFGAVGAALLGWQLVLQPAARLLGGLRRAALARQVSRRRWRALAIGSGAALVLALALPLPHRLLVPGVVWPADQAQLRAEEDGFVVEIVASHGQAVAAGALVLRLQSPSLSASLARQQARVEALETELVQAWRDDSSAAGRPRAELDAAQAALARLQERHDALEVRAQTAGSVALPQAADLAGQFVRRGRLLGQVVGADAGTVRVALLEADADELRRVAPEAGVRLASTPGAALPAMLVRVGGGATMRLPSAALSARHGGAILTDPADDLKPLQPVVVLDLRLSGPPDARAAEGREPLAAPHAAAAGGAVHARLAERLGERAWVRFDAGFSPLALQAARALQRQVQQRFNAQF